MTGADLLKSAARDGADFPPTYSAYNLIADLLLSHIKVLALTGY